MSPTESAGLLALLLPTAAVACLLPRDDQLSIGYAALVGLLACGLTFILIPQMKALTLKAGLKGRDLGKKGTKLESKEIPEALGIVCGIVYVMSIILSQMPLAKDSNLLAMYNAALLSITLILLLGFVDDVVDLKWRYKLVVPFVAAAPLVAMYSGATGIRIPQPLRPLLVIDGAATPLSQLLQMLGMHVYQPSGELVDMHGWYMLVVVLLVVFCTNAINIYAGVNGLEAGQALVIGAAMLFTNVFEMWQHPYSDPTWPHHFSMSLLLPFVGVTWALLFYNWYPADVFVGDTFCYFAGMTLAVSGILGNYSKTVLLFFAPQIFNFLYSMPQLFGVYPCPRHRLPKFDAATNTVSPSTFEYKGKTHDNLTLICLVLRICGPMHERTLVMVLMALQAAACVAGLWLRYALSDIVYDTVQQQVPPV